MVSMQYILLALNMVYYCIGYDKDKLCGGKFLLLIVSEIALLMVNVTRFMDCYICMK